MKIKQLIIPIVFSILLLAFNLQPAAAQNTAENKSPTEALLKSKNFIFKAQSAHPMRGSVVQLTTAYDLIVTGDTLQAYLPYYGRSYSAPINAGEGGIKLESTKFNYEMSDKGKKGWLIDIKPMDDAQVRQLTLSVMEGGNA